MTADRDTDRHAGSDPPPGADTPGDATAPATDGSADATPDGSTAPGAGAPADATTPAPADGTADTQTGSPGTAPPLRLVGVTKRYDGGGGTVTALSGVDFRVEPGEVVAVVGPSGSGKSTMLNLLGLLDEPTEGRVELAGRPTGGLTPAERTAARRESLGFVFQDFHLLPTLTALENVRLPTAFLPGDATDRARDLLERVGLGDRLDHTPDELSGGQKQRVAIARALVNDPAVLLADEPTGNLDRGTGTRILEQVGRVSDDGVGVVAVTHDDLVTDYADRTVDLVDGVLDG